MATRQMHGPLLSMESSLWLQGCKRAWGTRAWGTPVDSDSADSALGGAGGGGAGGGAVLCIPLNKLQGRRVGGGSSCPSFPGHFRRGRKTRNGFLVHWECCQRLMLGLNPSSRSLSKTPPLRERPDLGLLNIGTLFSPTEGHRLLTRQMAFPAIRSPPACWCIFSA